MARPSETVFFGRSSRLGRGDRSCIADSSIGNIVFSFYCGRRFQSRRIVGNDYAVCNGFVGCNGRLGLRSEHWRNNSAVRLNGSRLRLYDRHCIVKCSINNIIFRFCRGWCFQSRRIIGNHYAVCRGFVCWYSLSDLCHRNGNRCRDTVFISNSYNRGLYGRCCTGGIDVVGGGGFEFRCPYCFLKPACRLEL